jgi:hypothetical protein
MVSYHSSKTFFLFLDFNLDVGLSSLEPTILWLQVVIIIVIIFFFMQASKGFASFARWLFIN